MLKGVSRLAYSGLWSSSQGLGIDWHNDVHILKRLRDVLKCKSQYHSPEMHCISDYDH